MIPTKVIEYYSALSNAEIYWGEKAEEILTNRGDDKSQNEHNFEQLLLNKSKYKKYYQEKKELDLTAIPLLFSIKALSIIPAYILFFVSILYLPLNYLNQQKHEYNIIQLENEELPFIVTAEILKSNNVPSPTPTLSRPKPPTIRRTFVQ